ncbi:type IX secretion system membrane protein PorP/SprF [Mucilaginibacter sp. FT3.2]|uniref:PorP/SprF family type IX secretion system membrane protein n=1 Tax=Mucilaginibacter sp. FT3.2 TaxID=2723090 RepID=UPI0016190A55|nr:type IX secretion system membrane protein PorP/SprF [Mucilaginibacter sp. FT3.2]MBB6233929.1 type IX secretion system PorP/SprF family membrane protein [Mucilaginibacter sp. FT3.2]
MIKGFKLFTLIAGLVLLTVKLQAQQSIQFSQYMFNGLAVNPAYAGYKQDWTLNLSSRIQWVGINDAPKTGTLSVDGLTNSTNQNMGLGLIATFDKLGPESTSSVYLNYAYRLRLNDDDTQRLSFGLGFGAIQYRLDGTKFNATDDGDTYIPAGTQSSITPDFRFGIYYYSPTVYVGASVFNLLSGLGNTLDNLQQYKQARTVYLTGGAMVPLSETLDIKPSLLLKEDFKGPTNLDISNYIVFNKAVWVGASYRTGINLWQKSNLQTGLDKTDAVAAMVQFYVNNNFRLGYSYDFTTSRLASSQSGSHELSLSISFPGKGQRVVSPRYF